MNEREKPTTELSRFHFPEPRTNKQMGVVMAQVILRQLPLFDMEERIVRAACPSSCKGGGCSEALDILKDNERWKCMTCNRVGKLQPDGRTNCGITDKAYWDAWAATQQVTEGAKGA
jgi:hypothetical protein